MENRCEGKDLEDKVSVIRTVESRGHNCAEADTDAFKSEDWHIFRILVDYNC